MAVSDDRKREIAQLIAGINRYNPNNIEHLERHVELQCIENFYDKDANLALLKLYQFNMERFNSDTAFKVMMKAVMNLPFSDVTECKCVMPIIQEPEFSKNRVNADLYVALEMAQYLECCDFEKFWESYEENRSVVEPVKGFADAVRKYILHVIGITYQTVARDQVLRMLHDISEMELKEIVKAQGWQERPNGILFVRDMQDLYQPKNIKERITLESVAPFISSTLH